MRRVRRVRSGFTLLELMVSSLVGLIVLTSVTTLFLTTQRMLKSSMAESELALAMRELRDRLLFRVAPPSGDRFSTGLLSAVAYDDHGAPTRSTFENQIRQGYVELYAPTVAAGLVGAGESSSRASMRLRGHVVGSTQILINEHVPDRDRHLGWLWPGRLGLDAEWGRDCLDYSAVNPNDANNPMIYRIYLDLALKADVTNPDGSAIVRRERLAVPLCGRIQPHQDKTVGGNQKDTY